MPTFSNDRKQQINIKKKHERVCSNLLNTAKFGWITRDDEANKPFYLLFFLSKQWNIMCWNENKTRADESLHEIIIIVFV